MLFFFVCARKQRARQLGSTWGRGPSHSTLVGVISCCISSGRAPTWDTVQCGWGSSPVFFLINECKSGDFNFQARSEDYLGTSSEGIFHLPRPQLFWVHHGFYQQLSAASLRDFSKLVRGYILKCLRCWWRYMTFMFWLHSPFLAVDAATIYDQALIPTSSTRLCTDSTYVPLAYNTQKVLTCVDWLHNVAYLFPPSLSLEKCLPTSWPVIAAFMRTLWIHRFHIFHRNGKQLVIQMENSWWSKWKVPWLLTNLNYQGMCHDISMEVFTTGCEVSFQDHTHL